MADGSRDSKRPFALGIEGGGTRTVALLVDAKERMLKRLEVGPANLKLLTDGDLVTLLNSIAAELPPPGGICIGLAGARSEADWKRIRQAAGQIWPRVPCRATNDLETALASVDEPENQKRATKVLILSGTGSCCYGRSPSGKTARTGGWGHLLGDRGSGYEIGLRALKLSAQYHDQYGSWPALGRRIVKAQRLRSPDKLIAWTQSAGKADIAALAVPVFAAARRGDQMASQIVADAAESLATDALNCARQLAIQSKKVWFVLAGGVLLKQPEMQRKLAALLRKKCPGAIVTPLKRESAWGAVALARALLAAPNGFGRSRQRESAESSNESATSALSPRRLQISQWAKAAATEQRNPRSRNLDRMPLGKAIDLMLSEDAKIVPAIRSERRKIARAIEFIAGAFKNGGRLFYIGAGTSGRLGVLDASECPPTFRAPPEMVQGIIAGGTVALTRSIEGAEDDAAAGGREISNRKINRHDVVVGIAASGRTPFVWGALTAAKQRGAKTVLISFNPSTIPASSRPNLVISPKIGPEVLTGSTRLKAGTATKLILNMFTTLAMVRIGKVMGNLMVDVNPTNEKLRDRAVRMLCELCGVDYSTARKTLEENQWIVRLACKKLGTIAH